ncbi:hypothetical protein G7Y89_g13691 [Cudoniella acicularis]|uniref:Uncharacterized protein n=1 Tax=Cudoniella acicularis TaxID=354080 RepID=A0A8H4R6Z1_9HELO|nr:hypothetical protein G7Y89_g13691 [Cudoniella acicularis]
MSSCSRCRNEERKCVVDKAKSKRYSEYTRAGQKYDVEIPLLDLLEEEALSLAELEQRKLLAKREDDMTRRGLRFLEELDATKEAERVTKEREGQEGD